MIMQRKVSDHGRVVLSDDMVDNHVANSENEALAKTNARVRTKDVDSNTVVKGTPTALAAIIGEGDDKHYSAQSASYGYQWITDLTVWHYDTSTKGSSGYLVGKAKEETADVQFKLLTKSGNKPLVRVTGINDIDFV